MTDEASAEPIVGSNSGSLCPTLSQYELNIRLVIIDSGISVNDM